MADEARPHSDQELVYYHDGQGIEVVRNSAVWYKKREKYIAERGLTEDQYHQEVLGTIEEITGPLWPWQRFYIVAAVSGRGVEWAQTRGRPHYHIVGLPCPVCGRS